MKRKRVDVNLKELDQIIDHAREVPLSESESEKLKEALHALAGMLPAPRSTEKTSAVLPPTDPPTQQSKEKPKGHGRNGASSYTGAKKVAVPHPTLHSGDHCPGCEKGKVYPQKEPRTLVRVVGQAPLAATVYQLDRLRCNLCGEMFTAPEPEGVGPEKYDETTAAMIVQLYVRPAQPEVFSSDCGALSQFLETSLNDQSSREQAVRYGRAMGRVLAHELYHVLLETESHTRTGISKTSFTVADLLAKSLTFEADALALFQKDEPVLTAETQGELPSEASFDEAAFLGR